MAVKPVSGTKKVTRTAKTAKTTKSKSIKIDFSSKPAASKASPKMPVLSDVAKQSIDNITTKLKLKNYTKEIAQDSEAIIKKSQNHLIGLVKLYEGNPNNYYEGFTETYRDKGKGKTRTNGFGSTTNLKIKNLDQAYLQLEKDLVKANNAVIKTLNNDLKLGKNFFESLPASIREGLVDLCFNKGPGVIKQNKELIKALKTKDYSAVVWNLQFVYSIHDEKKTTPLPGLYRRSLSRAILASRDIKSVSAKEAKETESVIDKLYADAVKCYKKNGVDTKELDEVYNYYKTGKLSSSAKPAQSATPASAEKSAASNTSYTIKTFVVDDSLKGRGAWGVAKVNYDKQDSSKMTFKEYYEIFNRINKPEVLENIKVGTTVNIPVISQQKNNTKPSAAKKEITQKKKTFPKKISKRKPVSAKKSVSKPAQPKPAPQTSSAGISTQDSVIETKIREKSENPISRFFKGLFSTDTQAAKKDEIEEYGLDNDPNATPFKLLMSDKNKTIQKNKSVIKFKNGTCRDYTVYTVSLNYKVKKFSESPNETVWGISHRYGVNMNNFCENNNITDPSYISAGQTVKIQKLAYKVEKGDNINSIAKKFGLTPDILMQLNGIDDGDTSNLKVGRMIELPGFIYKVKKGETFESIAQRVGVDERILKYINGNKLGNEIRVLYNNPDFDKTLKSVKTISENGKKIERIDMSGVDKDVATREHLRYKTKVNGLVVANRAEFLPTNKNGKLKGKTIIINAGHGYGQAARDPGAVIDRDGLKHEWILNYDNSMRLIAKLQAQGARVIYLQGHRNLIQKALKQPENKGDLFISVHANIGKGDDKTKDRTQFYYRDSVQKGDARENSIKLATIAERIFNTKYKGKDYAEVRTNDDRTGVLKTPVNNQKIGGIIWEVAFMDSPKGRKRLKDNRTMNDYAYLMTQAVVRYFDEIKK